MPLAWASREGVLAAIALGTVSLVLLVVSPATVSDVEQVAPLRLSPVTLPYDYLNVGGTAEFELNVNVLPWTVRKLSFRVDDCLERLTVNGTEAFKHRCGGCDHCSGLTLNLGRYLELGTNRVHIQIRNNVGPGTLDIRHVRGFSVWHVLAWSILGAFWWRYVRRKSLPLLAWYLGVTGAIAAVVYRVATDPFVRQHDPIAHHEYIEHVLNHGSWPNVKAGWETWQPPAYYSLASIWIAIREAFGPLADRWAWAQVLSGLFYLVAVLIVARSWKEMELPTGLGYAGAFIFALVPAHIFISGRVSNESMMPLWGVITVVMLSRYQREGSLKVLGLLACALPVAIATKSSALAFAAASGLTVLVADHVAQRSLSQRLLRAALVGLPAACWWLFWMLRNHDQTGEWVYVMHDLPETLRLENSTYKYIGFDWTVFLQEGAYNTFTGKLRESWPLSLGASALTGEYDLSYLRFPIGLMRAAFLPVVGTFLAGIAFPPRQAIRSSWLPAALVFAFNLLFIFAYNWRYPYACHQDARMFGPSFCAVAVLYGFGWERIIERTGGSIRWFFRLEPLFFLGLLVVFYAMLVIV